MEKSLFPGYTIGADAYCEDAVSSVRAAKKFISQV